jgi:hypothetical protein
MQRDNKWKNWPVLVGGVVVAGGLILAASTVFKNNQTLTTYLLDLAGALTAVIISIATYDEWERRQERKRYLPPERKGVARIQEEIFQLMYQYAFVLNLRFNPKSQAMKIVEKTTKKGKLTKPGVKLKSEAGKQISQSIDHSNGDLFLLSREALKKPAFGKQSYFEANELIVQTENTIRHIDLAIATYGYSFTPEVHKWALDVREAITNAITQKIEVLGIRLAAASKNAQKPLDKNAAAGFEQTVRKIIDVGKMAQNVKVEI